MKRRGKQSQRGFTMLELIVAMVLIAGVMIGLNTFVFSMSELWGRGRDYRLFDQHARAGEGLVLYWQSALEEEFNTDPPREMVLSPLVGSLGYEYFDADFGRWEVEERLRTGDDGELETPGRIRLTFNYKDEEIQTIVPLTIFGEGLPPF